MNKVRIKVPADMNCRQCPFSEWEEDHSITNKFYCNILQYSLQVSTDSYDKSADKPPRSCPLRENKIIVTLGDNLLAYPPEKKRK